MKNMVLKIDHIKVLVFINIWSIILILITTLAADSTAIRIIVGIPYVLFFSGYAIIAALFPRKDDLKTIERIAISVGLSLAVIPLTGLLLNYIWEIKLTSLFVILTALIAVMSTISWYRGLRISKGERLRYVIDFSFFRIASSSRLDTALSVILVIAVIGIIITLVYIFISPKIGERFTEFYLLGLEKDAELYPREIILGNDGNISLVRYINTINDELSPWLPGNIEVVEIEDDIARVIIGISNREQEMMRYEVRVTINEALHENIGPVELENGGNWQDEVELIPQYTGENQKVQFKLYKIREFGKGNNKHTLLSMWFGSQELSSRIVNQGQIEARYKIEVEVDDGKEARIESIGPVILEPGNEWQQEIQYPNMKTESQIAKFSLYRDDTLKAIGDDANETVAFNGAILYKEESSTLEQSLHLWIDVKKGELEEDNIE